VPAAPAYLAGLLLSGRKVVAVGGGSVHRRRIPKLLAAGARVTVVAPQLHPDLATLVRDGALEWRAAEFVESDLDGAWYVLAATDSAEVNAAVAAEAERRHTFCVRADRAELGSAWTPATAAVGDATIGVLTNRDPRRARALRDRLLVLLEDADG
jgi:siroheme synthase-like protein